MKIWVIIKKEYKQIVKKKSFVIATILTPVLMGGFFFLPTLLTKVGRETKNIAIVDYSGMISEKLINNKDKNVQLEEKKLKIKFNNVSDVNNNQNKIINHFIGLELSISNIKKEIQEISAIYKKTKDKNDKRLILDRIKKKKILLNEKTNELGNIDSLLLQEYRDKVIKKDISGFLIIPEKIAEIRKVYYFALNISDFTTNKYISSRVAKILSSTILMKKIKDPEIVKIVDEATRNVVFSTFAVKEGKDSESSSSSAYMMSVFMLTILFSVIMAYGQLIMRGVIEEKNNRIVEVLISSTNTQTLFYGKIIGIGLAGLTQVLIWIAIGAVFLGKASLGIDKSITGFFTPLIVFYFLVFFVIGYFMYSVLFSIVGASVNTDQEAQQFAAPLTYLMFIPLIIGFMVTQNPNTPIVVYASLFPLFTPTLMFMRISVTMPSLFQIILSIVLSIASTMFLAWLGAKIFRTGILMYGKKPSIKEIIKWLKYK